MPTILVALIICALTGALGAGQAARADTWSQGPEPGDTTLPDGPMPAPGADTIEFDPAFIERITQGSGAHVQDLFAKAEPLPTARGNGEREFAIFIEILK